MLDGSALSWAYAVLGVALIILVLVGASKLLDAVSRRVDGTFRKVVLAGERLAALAVTAAEQQASLLVLQGQGTLQKADKKAIADTLYDALPSVIEVDGTKLPIGVFKQWFTRESWESAVDKAFTEAEALLGKVAVGVKGGAAG